MHELVLAALKGAFSFAGKKVAEHGYKKLTDQPISNEEYALRTALTTLQEERQEVGRLALQNWMATPEWRSGRILNQIKQGGKITAMLLSEFESQPHGLEAQDRPRVVAEAFLTAYWVLQLKEQGTQFLLDEEKLTLEGVRDVQRVVNDLDTKLDETNRLLGQVQVHLQTGGETAARVNLTGTPLTPSDPYAQKLERIEHSLEDFALAAARRRLGALAPEVEHLSEEARAKYLRLWGNLENNLGHREQAARYYIEAFEYDCTSPGGLTLRGYAAFLSGEPGPALTYLDRALGKQRRSDALALKVYASEALGRFEDIEVMRAQGVKPDDLEYALALAQTAIDQEHFDVAFKDLHPLLTGDEAQDARVKLTLARAKIMPLDLELRRTPRVITEIPALLEHRPEIGEALCLVDEVLAEPGGVAPALLELAANLKQVILFWQNRFPELLEAAQAALKADPDDVLSLRHAALAYMALDQPDEAWQIFTRIPEAERDVDVRTLGASAAERTGRAQEAASLLPALLQEALSPRARENALLMYVRVLTALGRPEEAQDLLNGEADDSALVWLARAEVTQALNDPEGTSDAFRHAIALADDALVVKLSLQYAAYLRDQEQLGKAVEVVTPVIGKTQDPETLSWLGYLLVRAEAFPEAKAVVEILEAQDDQSFGALDLSAAVYAGLGQWSAAVEREARLLEAQPTDGRVLWNAALARSELGQTEEMLALLRRFVTRPDTTGEDLMRAAELTARSLPGEEALNWAYQARRKEYGNPAMHQHYQQIATRCPHSADLPTVQPESAVHLVNDDGQRWVILTMDEAPSRDRGEFALDSREAQLLLGKELGNTVKLREGHGGTYQVNAILTKFANAERAFFEEFHQLFPADNSMIVIRFSDPRPEAETGLPEEWRQLRQEAEKTTQQRAEAGLLIDQRRYAHVLNATLNLESATSFWLKVFGQPGTYFSFLGEEADARAADMAVGAQAWMVDVSALLSLAAADRLEVLLVASVALKVTTKTVQQLETLADQDQRVARALHFVRAHVTVVEAPDATGELDSLFPEETVSAMAVAADQDLPLLTEDAGFRYSNRDGTLGPVLTSFGVADVLLALHRAGKLDRLTLEAHLLRLLVVGRLFLPMSTGLLQQALDHDAGRVGSALQAVLRMLLHPRIAVNYQAVVASDLLKLLWTQPDLSSRRHEVVRRLMDGLAAFEDRTQRFKRIYRVTLQTFHLLPQQVREVTTVLQKAQALWEP